MRIITAVLTTFIVVTLNSLPTKCFDALTFRTRRTSLPESSALGRCGRVRESKIKIFSGIGNSNVSGGDNDNFLLASLKKRASELEIQNEALLKRWKDAKCVSKARIVLDDWVRRVSLGKWPYVAIGSARGSIYLADCNSCAVVAEVKDVHNPDGGNEEALSYLHGPYDGGGTLAISMMGNVIASAGREGGVKIFHVTVAGEDDKNPLQKKLVSVGEIPSLKGSLVTSLLLDNEQKLWAGCYDGTLHMFDLDWGSAQKNSTLRVESGVLSVDVNNDIVVCGMKNGSVKMFSVDGTVLALWKPFSTTYVRSVKIVGGPDDSSWCVVAGGGDGQISARQLLVDSAGSIESVPFDNKRSTIEFSPRHGGSVVALASRQGGLMISGAQDGTLRVWDCWEKSNNSDSNYSSFKVKPTLLYNFVGYKVWLGSVCSDGNCLLSDGSDNSIIVHDFSVPIEYD
jgi:WD40 repeat protein